MTLQQDRYATSSSIEQGSSTPFQWPYALSTAPIALANNSPNMSKALTKHRVATAPSFTWHKKARALCKVAAEPECHVRFGFTSMA
jgi:hypothetical protein